MSALSAATEGSGAPRRGPPPLRPFGLVLHHDGRWSHEGIPVTHSRLRAAFDRGVRWLPEEQKYVVQLGRFRGQIEVEEAAFFVRSVSLEDATLRLRGGSEAPFDPATLTVSPRDGALLCRIPAPAAPAGLLARFDRGAQAELLDAVEFDGGRAILRVGGRPVALPQL